MEHSLPIFEDDTCEFTTVWNNFLTMVRSRRFPSVSTVADRVAYRNEILRQCYNAWVVNVADNHTVYFESEDDKLYFLSVYAS